MPRIFGVNIIATLVAGLALFMLGAVWFGAIFQQAWSALHAFTPEQIAAGEANVAISMSLGFLVSILSAGFLGFVLNKVGATSMAAALQWSLILCFGFVVLTQFYNPVYAMTPLPLFFIDAGYQVVGFPIMAAIHVLMRNVLTRD
ncbi:DUF1761 domain-containing protein [Maricaulis sp. D1M11]|uniref:DUF1761 domain-containing protein n=1 Tax=Maricaulis sp. D1M11 TaxID=3076117 RepID=UPI0039B3AB23